MAHYPTHFSRIPSSTYRAQLTPKFGFAAAADIVPYLNRLGIGDLYCSPVMTARPGSTHGYDVTDPLCLNPELGGEDDFARLVETLHKHGMGMLLDIVPNHMAASPLNAWWLDVLENGPSSEFADFFDVEWDPPGPGGLENRILLPILGSPYGETLENGEIQVGVGKEAYHLRYYETELPLATTSFAPLMRARSDEIRQALGAQSEDWRAYERLIRLVENVPNRASSEPHLIERRRAIREELNRELSRLRQNPAVAQQLDSAVSEINGTPGVPRSFDALDQIIAAQAYRLAFWQLAREQINYRRFFDINDLVSVRVEDENVFQTTHRRVLELVRDGRVNGLRIDHVDGLWDPEGYLTRLQHSLDGEGDNRTYVVVEKILSNREALPENWAVAGTTGYDFTSALNGLMVDQSGLARIDQTYRDVTGSSPDFPAMVYDAKRRVLLESFAANIESLTSMLAQIAEIDRHGRDLTFASLRDAIVEVTAALAVYRTYVNNLTVSDRDRGWIEDAVNRSQSRRPDLRHTFTFLRRVLLLEFPNYIPDENQDDWLRFVMRWQQITGPAMAKGSEDTALYQYNRLVSLNEVGGHPDIPGVSVEEFHAHNQFIAERWPHTLNATSTHDTKRSEDVRARIAVLSEIPDKWDRALRRWREMNAGQRPVRNATPIPDANVEMLIYQSLIGAWPLLHQELDAFQQRIKDYLIKASREAKTHTSWVEIDTVYENALMTFVDALFDPEQSGEFLSDLELLVRDIGRIGAINSLSQTLLKLTVPGTPDTYQGTELWDLSLVDPDNRRPVDYHARQRGLDSLTRNRQLDSMLADWRDGLPKLFLTHQVLALRRRLPYLFAFGDYVPLEVDGTRADHVVAFARRHGNATIIVVAPVHVANLVEHEDTLSLEQNWQETSIRVPFAAPESFTNHLGGEDVHAERRDGEFRLMVSKVLRTFPGGLLISEP